MNLTIDSEAIEVIAEARRVFQAAFPSERLRTSPNCSDWPTLVATGWDDLGAAVIGNEIDLGTAAGIFRSAGRSLLMEEFVTSAFVLSTLLSAVVDRADSTFADRSRPGVLLGEGRERDYDYEAGETGYCFGVSSSEFDIYRLARIDDAHFIERAIGGDVTVRPVAQLSRGVGRVEVKGASWRSTPISLDDVTLAGLRRREILLHSAALLGCAEEIIDRTRHYTVDRVQFSVPIATFQAVKHMLADASAATVVAWAAVLCACADENDARLDVARLLTVEATLSAARAGAQLHGGIGFTWESELHFFLKAALDGVFRYGSPDETALRIGREVLARC